MRPFPVQVYLVLALLSILPFGISCAGDNSSNGGGSKEVETDDGAPEDEESEASEESDSDTSPPTITITSSDTTSVMPYSLTGMIIDDVGVVASSYTIDSGDVTSIDLVDGSFSVELTLAEGVYAISVIASDAAGNSMSSEITLTYSLGGGLSSAALIDDALANGDIDEETATLYKVYVAYGDDRLPTEFQGDDSNALYNHVMDDVAAQWGSLSLSAQAILEPFFAPPYYQGSWHDLRTITTAVSKAKGKVALAITPCNPLRTSCPLSADWEYVGGTHVKVWYLTPNASTDRPKAEALVALLDNQVWNDLTSGSVMGAEPLPDTGQPIDGDDPRLDISLVDLTANDGHGREGSTIHPFLSCKKTSVFIMMNRSLALDRLLPAAVHEFMHAIQFSYDVSKGCIPDNYKWLMESTATWAVDHVFQQTNQWEHDFAKDFLDVPQEPINSLQTDFHPYGAYLFPFFIERTIDAATIGQIWAGTLANDELHSVEIGLGGSGTNLEEQWPEFVLRNWNQDPITDYMDWDALSDYPVNMFTDVRKPNEIKLNGGIEDLFTLPINLPHLSAQYIHLTFPDDTVRTVSFLNGLTHKVTAQTDFPKYGLAWAADELTAEQKKGAFVQALVKIGGNWKAPENWTDVPFRTFCRDKTAERIQEVVMIFSNSDIENQGNPLKPQGVDPFLFFSNIGCWKWRGEVHFVDNDNGVKRELDVTATWEAIGPFFDKTGSRTTLIGTSYRISEGSLDWQISGTDSSGCTYSGSRKGVSLGTLSSVPSALNFYQNYNYVVDVPGYRSTLLTGFLVDGTGAPIIATITRICSSSADVLFDPISPVFSVVTGSPNSMVDAGGTLISGNQSDAKGGKGTVTGLWNFIAEREP